MARITDRKAARPLAVAAAGIICCPVPGTAQVAQWRLEPEPLVSIGVVEGDPAYMFQSIRFARFLADGRIVAADDGTGLVRVYGADGDLDAQMGGSGEGPGEFLGINGLWITPDGMIGVWDSHTRRLTIHETDGSLASSDALTGEGASGAINLEVFAGALGGGDVVLASLSGGRPSGDDAVADPWTLHRFGADGAYRERIGGILGMRRIRGQPYPFTSLPYFGVLGDSLLVSDGPEPVISVRDAAGETIRTIDLPLAASASGDEIWTNLEAQVARDDRPSQRLLIQHLEWMPRDIDIPTIGGLLVDDTGLMWIKRFDPMTDGLYLKTGNALAIGPGGEWVAVQPTGEVVATIRMPSGTVPMDVDGDRLLGVNRDELDVERLIVYRLER